MISSVLKDISITPLKIIETEGGDVLRAMRNSDEGFVGFSEAYFTWIKFGFIKAWKMHEEMTLNLVVPKGQVRFVFHVPDEDDFRIEEIGEGKYERITVPPGIWFGFKGLDKPKSLIMNLADKKHEPNEVQRRSAMHFKYNW